MSYEQATADRICRRLENGESLRKAAKAEGVDPSTVLRWEKASTNFAQQYASAREVGYKRLADELIEIADDSSGDVIQTDHGPKADPEFVARARLRLDTRKWMLSKMLPKVYGERLELAGTLAVRKAPADYTDAELLAIVASAKAKADTTGSVQSGESSENTGV